MPKPMEIDEDPDRRRIRIGLAFLVLVVAVSLVMVFVIEAPAGKIVMAGIAVFTIIRSFMLARALRRARA